MKNVIHLTLGVLLVALVWLFAPKPALAQDMVTVAPTMCKVLLENDKVRVIEVNVKPGENIPMHSHPSYIVYALSTGKVKHTSPDGKIKEREVKTGEAGWNEAETHVSENTGTTEAHVLVIELKKPQKMQKKMEESQKMEKK